MAANVDSLDVSFPCARDGADIFAHAAWPGASRDAPALVIVPDVRGLYDFYRDVARRFAEQGFFAIAVDIYSREGAPELADMPAVFEWIRELPDERVLGDLAAAVTFAAGHERTRDRSVGITGFCVGGQYALLAACTDDRLRACVSWYGMLRYEGRTAKKPADPLDLAAQLHCPYLGLFGADDELIPPSDVEALRSLLKKHGKTFEIEVYAGAGHAFFNETRPDTYRPDAAARAWPRAIAFLQDHLR